MKENIYDMKESLLVFAELMNDEFGEACIAVCEFYDSSLYIYSDELKELLEKEIETKLKYCRLNFEIKQVTTQETVTRNELVEKY